MKSEIAKQADFSGLRYAQCWEDADILLEALDVRPGQTCLSIASAGDNTLAMLSRAPERVLALDLSPSQLACLELRVAAYRELSHVELLELIGSRPSGRRAALYRRCRGLLSPEARCFWDGRANAIDGGVGGAGRFERYFALFRERALPLVHSRRRVEQLLGGGDGDEREAFYEREWNTWRWRAMFKLFFSRQAMGRLGRDPSFFRHVEGGVAARILSRARHALVALDPRDNPYVQWILTGRHASALPYALRAENFEAIRANLHRLEWRRQSVEEFLSEERGLAIDRFNLSDIFEYVSIENYQRLLDLLLAAGRAGSRLVYWNLLVERRRPASMALSLRSLDELATRLHARDKAFFYSALVIEEVI
jgi:S-adenosylmethionine-diacylglycerol 3-amino-3-carboxypropyl transferase